jgi:outer membrane protein, heavy metal efflux system
MKNRLQAAALAAILGSTAPMLQAQVDWQRPQSLVDAAVASNPTLARSRAELEVAQQRALAAGSLPNPMLMTGIQDLQVNLEQDEMMTMYMVGASQTFTRGSKRTAGRRAAEALVRAVEQNAAAVRAEIERDVLLAYYDIAAADEQTATIEQVREAVDAVVAAARVRYEIGGASQAEVIRAQLEKSTLERQLISLRGARRAAAARLLPLLDLPPDTDVPRLRLPVESRALDIAAPAEVPENHPALEALRAEIESQDQQIELARLARKPDVSLEASYGLRPEQTDMITVVASVELPIRRRTLIEPRIREAAALREVAERRVEETRRQLAQDLAVAKAVHDEMNEQFMLHDQVLVPQARLAFESTLAAYQSGKSSFDAILSAETTFLGLQLQYYQYLARHLQAIIDFEQLQRGARSGRIGGTMAAAPPSLPSSPGSGAAPMNSM